MGIFRGRVRPALATAAIAVMLFSAGCAPASSGDAGASSAPAADSVADTEAMLAGLGLDASDPTALTEALEAMPVDARTAEFTAAVTPTEVRVQPDQPGELIVPIPDDQFYLSIAPYRTQTHPCTFHVPTSCLGELRSVDAQLRVTDAGTGEVIVEREARTEDNGFVGVWLPRDGEFTVEVTVDGDTGTQLVRTGDEDPTCLTTLQLDA